jgi:hypothetical protein
LANCFKRLLCIRILSGRGFHVPLDHLAILQ